MRRILSSVVIAIIVVAGSAPSYAKTDCKKDIAEFDAAAKTTKVNKAELAKATKLRDEANKDCLAKGGSAMGDADMQQALKLIGAR
ncbi:hypothetical protein B5K03_33700 [Rhizobium phaseoli]|uniref:hypothetical protein n=1 Tax=Rhizobium phaseoli TaxID=396 RepID=UPI000D672445|nr:hypothetical protein [Rhizobium phaseoli]PWI49894.1 hypothetical protein B5K03_33700 [Rhizobium phaseoli]